jgi:5-formyltetrahydrofolate cyclo-ligase
MDSEKSAIRQTNRRRRRALDPVQLRAAARAVTSHVTGSACYRSADAVLAYVATDGEVLTDALLAQSRRDGKAVFLPRVTGDDLIFAACDGEQPLVPGRFGIPEPTGPALDLERFRSVLACVPVVAWDASGGRLGRGAGFYDRALRALRGSVCIVGLAYSWQVFPRLPLDPWDVPLDFVVTEAGVLRCRPEVTSAGLGKEDESSDGLLVDDSSDRAGRGRHGLPHRLPATATERGPGAVDSGNRGTRPGRGAR